LSNGGLGISVVEAWGSVTGRLVRGILGKSAVEMRGGLNWLRIVSGGGFDISSVEQSYYYYFRGEGTHHYLVFLTGMEQNFEFMN
jgi:hypothetical protein